MARYSGYDSDYECDGCSSRNFNTREGLVEHYRQSPHHFYCKACDEHFSDAKELNSHFHFDVPDSCVLCQKHFLDENGLASHYKLSKKHRSCIECGREYSAAALIMHFESGTCKTGIRGVDVDQAARGQDRGGVLSDRRASHHRGEDPYFCPEEGEDVRFATFGALCQHFENSSCEVGEMVEFKKTLDGLISRVILKSWQCMAE
ncbi:hypothetical protein E1B28_001851 [Marasmius oreades]|uniref:C2H2-type domain-containing protein n=1 Tax=Marasmius oreades TaxID=181124 RepID=A0A9P7V4G0_9AGAR|nr:uncharacterized protein E1B28_001851 [Marasmius oreades]KAG7100067.1 hypothetical protein E1B28_001851 [Marasmius oreades]